MKAKIPLFWLSMIYILMATNISLARENITVEAAQKPLGKVIAEISETTGYQVIIDESYLNTPITIHIQQRPLEEALKRILGHLNHVIIYDDLEKTIKIKIFDESASPQDPPSRRMPPRQYHEDDSDRIIDSKFEDLQTPEQGDHPPDKEVSSNHNEDTQ